MKHKRQLSMLGVICALAFIVMIVIVVTGSSEGFDKAAAMWAYKIRSAGMNTLIEGITYIGNWSSIVTICVLLVAFKTTRHTGLTASLVTAITWILNKGIQHIIMRERPDEIMRLIEQGGPSFPSAHASSSMALFISIAICLFIVKRYKKESDIEIKTDDKVLPVICIILPFIIAFSRVYLGVHWTTDVIAGALEGLAVALISVPTLYLLAEKIETRIEAFLMKGARERAEE